jgi:hypothetical protein
MRDPIGNEGDIDQRLTSFESSLWTGSSCLVENSLTAVYDGRVS